MITEPKMYGLTCDNCSKQFETHEGFIAMNDEGYMIDCATSSGWWVEYNDSELDEHYCDSCWITDDEDNLIVLPKK